jgi:biopolymer transport protein ExbB/TolQ
MNRQVDDPDAFILFSRVKRAVLSLRNIGRVSDVEAIIQSQSDGDANSMDTSYTLVKGFLWAMPVLGFIGTVQGLSVAIGQFSTVLAQNTEVNGLRDSLKGVVLGLSVAFDTTLVALICTLILQLLMSYLRKKEEEFLGRCDDYCHRNLVSKLRLLGHEAQQS